MLEKFNLISYDSFVNESRKINLISIPKKHAVVLKASIDTKKDIDFKKTAETWWGRNISSLYNMWESDDHRKYKKGEILWIQKDNSYAYINLDNALPIMPTHINALKETTDRFLQFITILHLDKKIEILPLSKISGSYHVLEFLVGIKMERLLRQFKRGIFYRNEKIVKTERIYNSIEITTENSNKTLHSFIFSKEKFISASFLNKFKKEITSDPFK